MCRWRQIQDTYAHCGHMYRLPDEMVYCPQQDCKFSPYHPPDCGPKCSTTCWQYRRFPEQIDRRLDRLCPACQRAEDARQAALAAQGQGSSGQGSSSGQGQYQSRKY